MMASSKPLLRRLVSLKRCEGDASTCLLGAETGCCSDYSSCPPKPLKPSALDSVKRVLTKWKDRIKERSKARQKMILNEELKMRHKLEYHFMTPFEKYRKGRKPWKLAIQILKILIVTIQVSIFAVDRFAFISFFRHTEDAFHHLFVKGWNDDYFLSYYSRQEITEAINFANRQYFDIKNVAIGTYWYTSENQSRPDPMQLCVKYKDYGNYTFDKNKAVSSRVCIDMGPTFDVTSLINQDGFFSRVEKIDMNFKLNSVYLAGLKFARKSEWFTFKVKLRLNNVKNDGRLPVSLRNTKMKLIRKYRPKESDAKLVTGSLEAFDITVILVCMLSCGLCVRSVVRSIALAKKAKIYFKKYRNEKLTRMDLFQLVNKWFILIVISDGLAIVGSCYKLLIDEKDLDYYNVCSLLFGVAVLLVWIGLLRFLTYLKAYNILMITLRVAAPNLLRFISCVIFIFLGFSFCGWIVLGPFHVKFATLLLTMECLFSLLNGDDMYPTFTKVNKRAGMAIVVFSQLYLYFFISFFIYVVLSTFIGIVGDTYERLKDWGRLPQTRIQRFIEGKRRDTRRQYNADGSCHRCVRYTDSGGPTTANLNSNSLQNSLSDSQLSVESASLE